MAIFIKHTGCDRCGSSDALALYSDGSTFCFSCGISSGRSVASFIPAFDEDEDEEAVHLPTDLSHEFPEEVVQWLKPTGVTIDELLRFGYFYSRAERGLVRLLWPEYSVGSTGSIRPRASAYEIRRSFRRVEEALWIQSKGPKTLFRGSKEKAFGYVQLLETGRSEALCIVEDSISAIKAGRYIDSMPLFGSSISNNKLTQAVKEYDKVYVWLDSDKLNSARNIADRIKLLGKEAVVVYTELDPKYLDAQNELV